MAAKDPTPPPPPQSKARRSPTDVQRDRLTERIAKLRAEFMAAVEEAHADLDRGAQAELIERKKRSAERIAARYSSRIDPLQAMLAALTPAAPGKGES